MTPGLRKLTILGIAATAALALSAVASIADLSAGVVGVIGGLGLAALVVFGSPWAFPADETRLVYREVSLDKKQPNDLPRSDVLDRLWPKVQIGAPHECWPFMGYRLKGYGRIGLGTREEGTAYAHRVVTKAVHGPAPFPGAQARHLCGNPACCNPAHLAWGDQSANEMDKVSHGRSNRGARHGMSKLSESDVREIRRRLAAGETQRSIAERFSIAPQSVSEIATGRTWGWMRGGDV